MKAEQILLKNVNQTLLSLRIVLDKFVNFRSPSVDDFKVALFEAQANLELFAEDIEKFLEIIGEDE